MELALVDIAFAFAAIVALAFILTLVVSPTRRAADFASGIIAIGGALSWLLSRFADLMEDAARALDFQVTLAKAVAVSAWNTITFYTVDTLFADRWRLLGDTTNIANEARWIARSLRDNVMPAVWAWIDYLKGAMAFTISRVDYLFNVAMVAVWGELRAIEENIRGIEAGIDWLRNVVIRSIDETLARVRGDVDTLARWADVIGSQVLPRLQDDINARALESEAAALRDRVRSLEGQMAVLVALTVIATAGAEAIQNLRCVMRVPCDPLSSLVAADIEDRVTDLEVAGA